MSDLNDDGDPILDKVDFEISDVVQEQFQGNDNVIKGVDPDLSDSGYKMSEGGKNNSPRNN